jgi:hypothetical protein
MQSTKSRNVQIKNATLSTFSGGRYTTVRLRSCISPFPPFSDQRVHNTNNLYTCVQYGGVSHEVLHCARRGTAQRSARRRPCGKGAVCGGGAAAPPPASLRRAGSAAMVTTRSRSIETLAACPSAELRQVPSIRLRRARGVRCSPS